MARPEHVEEKLPRVLLIGDSISIGYTRGVRMLLQGKANVFRPPTNCGPTTNGLKNLEAWLGQEKWDVIHFNWGLHDLKFVGQKGDVIQEANAPGTHRQVAVEDYAKNLKELVSRMKKIGAKLIWCSTTPVPEGAKGRVPGDEVTYNAAAAKIMKEAGIPTNDLYTAAKAQLESIQKKADVHFKSEGSTALAKVVAETVEKALAK